MARVWRFKTVAETTATSAAHYWHWQAVLEDKSVKECARVFGTLRECVENARQNGFSGSVEPFDHRIVSALNGHRLEISED
jgi:hypothetical protein